MKTIIFNDSPWVLLFEQKNQKKTLSSEETGMKKIIENDQLWEEHNESIKVWWLFSKQNCKWKKMSKMKIKLLENRKDKTPKII